jgi:PAS domain S-box-containing protein
MRGEAATIHERSRPTVSPRPIERTTKKSVLVLDDKAGDRDLLASILRHAGYVVQEASSGEAALNLARKNRPDLITANVLTPGVNGAEFVQSLREDPSTSELPVIFCTSAYDQEAVRGIARDCGVSYILVMPSAPEEVARVVRTALGSERELAEAAAAELFDREQFRDLNEKLVQKAIELEVVNREQAELWERHRESEQAAAETMTLLESVQETAPIGIGFLDREFRIVRMNEKLAATNGRPLEEQLGRLVSEVVPALWPELEPIYSQILDSGEALVNQPLRGPSAERPGQVTSWIVSYYPVTVESEVIGIGVVALDVTELKQAEDFRSAVTENMAEGLYAVDEEGRLAFMNRAASTMLGWAVEELRGKPIHEAIHFQRRDGSPYPLEECEGCRKAWIEGKTFRVKEDAYTRKDGSIFPVSISAAPLHGDGGTNISGAVVVFRDTTDETAEKARMQRELDALAWVGRVREALDEDRFVLYSQPIVPLAGAKASEELLIRMLDRDGNTIQPGSFLPVAEKYGLIAEIDRWVISEAIRQAASGRRIQANLSAASISEEDLFPLIERELRDTGADPADVVFELTETALMEDLEAGEAFARRLVELGLGLALDDFGTGFGSFTYLKKLPIRYIKIDIEFVRDLVSNLANQHLVKATVGLAHDFGYETIAEGVEDAETLALLKDYGVDFAQGAHLGRPEPVRDPVPHAVVARNGSGPRH